VLPRGELTCIKLEIVRAVHKSAHYFKGLWSFFCPFVA